MQATAALTNNLCKRCNTDAAMAQSKGCSGKTATDTSVFTDATTAPLAAFVDNPCLHNQYPVKKLVQVWNTSSTNVASVPWRGKNDYLIVHPRGVDYTVISGAGKLDTNLLIDLGSFSH